MTILNQSNSTGTAATYSVVPEEGQQEAPMTVEQTAGTRSSLQDVLCAWICFVLLFAAFGAAALIFDFIR